MNEFTLKRCVHTVAPTEREMLNYERGLLNQWWKGKYPATGQTILLPQ
jgi:hypothetical protein